MSLPTKNIATSSSKSALSFAPHFSKNVDIRDQIDFFKQIYVSFAPHFTDKKLANMSVQRTSSSNSSLSFVPQFTKENKVALSV